MAVRYYDEAVVNKINKWIKDSSMTVLAPNDVNNLFRVIADKSNDSPLKLPLIAISRDTSIEIVNPVKKTLAYAGGVVGATEKTTLQMNAIPIKLGYQLDIYTRTFAEADEYIRNFVFNFINYNTLKVEFPYNGTNIEHEFSIQLGKQISDNSSVPERLVAGQFYRMTISFSIEDAYLISIPFIKNWAVEPSKIEEIEKENK